MQKRKLLKAERNEFSQKISEMKRNKENADEIIARMREVGDEIKELDDELREVEEKFELYDDAYSKYPT